MMGEIYDNKSQVIEYCSMSEQLIKQLVGVDNHNTTKANTAFSYLNELTGLTNS